LQRVLTTVTLLGLLVATAAAFAITEHLKLEKSPIYGTRIFSLRPGKPAIFSPVCGQGCLTRLAQIGLTLRHTGRVTVTIHDSDGHRVATIAPSVLMHSHQAQTFNWDGETVDGAVAPDGVYYPWVTLQRRTYKFINKITLDTVPPKVLKAAGEKAKPVLFGGRGRSVAIRYSLSERAHAVLYLRGQKVAVGRHSRMSDKIKWTGKLDGRRLPAGRYVLSIGAQDLAGNLTKVGDRKSVPVVLRYVELTPQRTSVKAGRSLTVHVETAARRYTWRLGKKHGGRRGKTLRLSAPTAPGTYHLVVTANGHAASAVVRVRAR
jgi:hypothetical protein